MSRTEKAAPLTEDGDENEADESKDCHDPEMVISARSTSTRGGRTHQKIHLVPSISA